MRERRGAHGAHQARTYFDFVTIIAGYTEVTQNNEKQNMKRGINTSLQGFGAKNQKTKTVKENEKLVKNRFLPRIL